MLKLRSFSQFVFEGKLKYKVNYQKNVRWATAVSAGKISYFEDAALEAAKPFKELPSLLSLPFIGTAWVFIPIIGRYDLKNFSKVMVDKRRLLGDIFREKFGPLNFVITFNADDLQTIYKNEGPYPSRTDLASIKTYRESRKDLYKTIGLTLLQGEEWLDLRKKTQRHLMKPKAIQSFLSPMQDVARDLVNKILEIRDENGEITDFLVELNKWSLESVALVALDTRLGCLKRDLSPDSDGMKMINCVQTVFDCTSKLEAFSGNLQIWKYISTPTWKRFTKASDTFAELAFKHINRSLEKLKSAPEDQDLTLLQSMLITEGMDTSTAMVMVSDMLMAGIDTTSHTVGFFLYHMARNPDKQELLYQDIKKILPGKDDRITPATFNEFRYLKACIKESQRLHPIVGAHLRTMDHDIILSGHRIPAGTAALGVVEGIFKDEKYFSNPEEFLPERWLKKDEKFHPFAFLPFGFGTRSCVGRRLAELEIISLATDIIRNFKVEYHYEDIGMYLRLINVPDKPLKMKFIER